MSWSGLWAARRVALGLTMAIGLAATGSAQPSRELARAGLGCPNAGLGAEVERRSTGGDTPRGVMDTIMPNNVQLRQPATGVLVVDFLNSAVVRRGPDGAVRLLRWNPATAAPAE